MKLGNPSIGKLKKGDRIGSLVVQQVELLENPEPMIYLTHDSGVKQWVFSSFLTPLIEYCGVEREEKWKPTGVIVNREINGPGCLIHVHGPSEPGMYRYIEERLVQ